MPAPLPPLIHALLGFVHDRPAHGYDIQRQLAAGLGAIWQVRQSKLYALLGKLEQAGWLSAEIVPSENRPARKLLHLTPAGREALHTWLDTPVQHGHRMRQEFLAKLYIGRKIAPDRLPALIDRQRAVCAAWLPVNPVVSDDPVVSALIGRFRTGQIAAMLAWLDQCERSLTTP
jgi:DNA-binding PadR family transcriptional regulator